MLSLKDLNLKNKRVVIREDFNVPLQDGIIKSDARIQAALPTIRFALSQGASVILLSHLGRPVPNESNLQYSLKPVAEHLSFLLGQPVSLIRDYLNGIELAEGSVVLCENVRFNPGEKKNDPLLAEQLAALGDIYVMDAFGTAHRSEASTVGAIHYAKTACAGPLLIKELSALRQALENPEHPFLAIVGGGKVSSKLTLLENISDKADQLLLGGGILNTFLLAAGYSVGKSLCEPELVEIAKRIMQKMKERGNILPLPSDVVVATAFSSESKAVIKKVKDVNSEDFILDIGPETAKHWANLIQQVKTIVWNGPLGVFEFDQFAQGTKIIGEAIAQAKAFSVAGGGDTLAAIEKFNLSSGISYISTGGGAFLEYLEGRVLPAVGALDQKQK